MPRQIGSPPVMDLHVSIDGEKETFQSVQSFTLSADGTELTLTYPDRFEEEGIPTEKTVEADSIEIRRAYAERMYL